MAQPVEFRVGSLALDGVPMTIADVYELTPEALGSLSRIEPGHLRAILTSIDDLGRVQDVHASQVVFSSAERRSLAWASSISVAVTDLELYGLFERQTWSLPTTVRRLVAPWDAVMSLDTASAAQIHTLHVGEFGGDDLRSLAAFQTLEELRIDSARRLKTWDSLPSVDTLRRLEVGPSPRLDMRTLPRMEGLASLWVSGVRGTGGSLTFVEGLQQLEDLTLEDCGKWASAEPLGGLQELETLALIGTTALVDGNLASLLSLQQLRHVRIAAKRHYQPPAQFFRERYPPD